MMVKAAPKAAPMVNAAITRNTATPPFLQITSQTRAPSRIAQHASGYTLVFACCLCTRLEAFNAYSSTVYLGRSIANLADRAAARIRLAVWLYSALRANLERPCTCASFARLSKVIVS